MTAQDLKNSILQLAVQGKLVPQDPSDEPVNLKGLRLKNTDECEFDIPDGWRLAHLESISTGVPSKQYQILESEVKQHGKYSVISQSKAYSIGYTDNIEKVYSHKQPIVVFGDHTTEVKYLDFDFVVGADGVKIFEPVYRVITAKFLFYALQFYSIGLSKVGGYSRHYKFIKNKPIPLPPIAEQERIVAKIEELLPLVESYGKEEERLKELNAEFPDKLRKSILQQAVQGKLTERDPSDEPASELIKRIRAERAVLQKNKATKKSQANETIAVDEIPFDIPDTWEWVNLGWICQKVGAGSTPKGGSAVYVPEGIKFLREQNIHDDGLRLDGVAYIDEQTHAAKAGSQVQAQDILMNITGASIGRNALVPDDFDTANVNQHVLIIRLVDKELRHYLHYCFSSPAVLNQMFTKQAGDKPGLSATKVENFLIPIPPLAEQKRIVARVEELLAVCDGLK